MPRKYRPFSCVSERQKRRRLAIIRDNLIAEGTDDEIENMEACNNAEADITINERADDMLNPGPENQIID